MKLIGLTGGPGCGKSAVIKIFSEFDSWRVFDADRICHEIYAERNGPFLTALCDRWGKGILSGDGSLNRRAVAEKIFHDEEERLWLNSLLHPEIFRRLELAVENCSCGTFVMIEAALLFESAWHKNLHRTIAVWTDPEIQMRRLADRGWTRDEALARIRTQLPQDKKLEMADFGIINNGSLESLAEQCRKLDRRLKEEI